MVEYADLLREARKARLASYSPYSHFRVGAAVLAASGQIYHGANVENASYSLCICAERVATVAAVMAGEKRIVAVACVGSGDAYCSPCGACRQFLAEFAEAETELMVIGEKGDEGEMVVDKLSELLPKTFKL